MVKQGKSATHYGATPDQNLQNQNREEARNHRQSRQPIPNMVTMTRSIAEHDSTNDKIRQPQRTNIFDTSLTKVQVYLSERQWHADDQGLLVNKLQSAWLDGVCLRRDSNTDEHLRGTPSGGGVRSCIETPSGEPTVGHFSLVETETGHTGMFDDQHDGL